MVAILKRMGLPIIALNGGLGNQLFQWYFAHTLESEKKFRIDCLFESSDTELGQREFRLEELAERCSHVSRDVNGLLRLSKFERFWHLANRLWLVPRFRPLMTRIGYFRENPNSEVAQSLSVPSPMRYAFGFFQSAKIVEQAHRAIEVELLPIIKSNLMKVKEKYDLDAPYTAIHVRRYPTTGYKLSPIHFCNLDSKYFIEWAKQNAGEKVILLTESSDQVGEIVSALKPDLVLDASNSSPFDVLAIMAGAEKCLGSNSSLSWWGAKLCSIFGGQASLPSNWSYWDNVDASAFHFKECVLNDSVWDISGFD